MAIIQEELKTEQPPKNPQTEQPNEFLVTLSKKLSDLKSLLVTDQQLYTTIETVFDNFLKSDIGKQNKSILSSIDIVDRILSVLKNEHADARGIINEIEKSLLRLWSDQINQHVSPQQTRFQPNGVLVTSEVTIDYWLEHFLQAHPGLIESVSQCMLLKRLHAALSHESTAVKIKGLLTNTFSPPAATTDNYLRNQLSSQDSTENS